MIELATDDTQISQMNAESLGRFQFAEINAICAKPDPCFIRVHQGLK